MNLKTLLGPLGLVSALTSCGSAATDSAEEPATGQSAEGINATYEAAGTITGIGVENLTISHGPVAGLNWPAMTMSFDVPADMVADELAPGVPVRFSFKQAGTGYMVTSITVDPAP